MFNGRFWVERLNQRRNKTEGKLHNPRHTNAPRIPKKQWSRAFNAWNGENWDKKKLQLTPLSRTGSSLLPQRRMTLSRGRDEASKRQSGQLLNNKDNIEQSIISVFKAIERAGRAFPEETLTWRRYPLFPPRREEKWANGNWNTLLQYGLIL